jgi:hypothetical protein
VQEKKILRRVFSAVDELEEEEEDLKLNSAEKSK